MLFYQARWMDPGLGIFTQADTVIPNPGNPLDTNRYSYVRNNPLKYTDPSGHICYRVDGKQLCTDDDDWSVRFPNRPVINFPGKMVGLSTDLVKEGNINVVEAQYVIPNSATYPAKFGIHNSLCPHLSFSVIYEKVTGESHVLGMMWERLQTHPDEGATPGELMGLIESFHGWNASIHWADWRNPYNDYKNITDEGNYIIFGNSLDTITGKLEPPEH